ncbi:putative enoyl-CoA hydratase [Bosea sp. 62]|uniref:enoyl-CoA hydratase/isomerase family protein n=1 Tax=unclassified Bosea (in: a-proteobacteria) TaxID=2653178 RepID=UPI0012511921|nr:MULTISPECIES: enoyl-CoA hydratase-related protein [unclassified Bosea (in: a-proteobacteria)]CAD5252196.1 putative enoyl-CoA hydratase [Bosea sp. 46]CAD5256870.1 putative enoyl-CoA hydratase [Bosea sp. 21B]CAD5284212.1 putative enoyl-CoA hydratase [Bosea sp. 7B]VVT56431.1 putative enoyl-CoA hydratase [Bosea sp. EC-HK365B]VXB33468.1 putative enoyl-CoA hydratase [Bosea sp. 29B]
MDQAGSPVLLTIEQSVAVITLNRPRVLNAIDPQMARSLRDAIARVAQDGTARALLLRGEGRAFCAGGDVARFLEGDPTAAIEAIIDPVHEALRALDALKLPTVAVVQGAAAGAGFSLSMACDLCIAADDAVFNLAFARIGISPDSSSTYRLPRLVGTRKALELAMLAEPVHAPEALALGLVNRVVPAAELASEAMALARRLAQGPTAAYARIKHLIGHSLGNDLSAQLDLEREAFLAGARTADFKEGTQAFLAKRPPQFEGR